MKGKRLSGSLKVLLLWAAVSAQLYGASPYFCSSPDLRASISATIAEDAQGRYQFMKPLRVYFDGENLRQISPPELQSGSEPYRFQYYSSQIQLHLNWHDRVLWFYIQGESNSKKKEAAYYYLGPPVCYTQVGG